jgi:hypothetical protein
MRPPSRVKVSPLQYTVKFDSEAMKVADANGVCLNDVAAIYLQTGNHPLVERETFLHELLHALWNRSGLNTRCDDGPPDSPGELIIQDIAGPLLALLRDNPAVVRYLTEKV